MTDLEQDFIVTHERLHTAAREARYAKKAVALEWMEAHYPSIYCEITFMEDVLALDVVFPGQGDATSARIANELNQYIQELMSKNRK